MTLDAGATATVEQCPGGVVVDAHPCLGHYFFCLSSYQLADRRHHASPLNFAVG